MSAQGAAASQYNPRGAGAQRTAIAVCVLALVCVILRIAARLFIVKRPGLDDASVAISWVFSLGVTIAIAFQVRYGLGLRQASLGSEDIESLFMSFWFSIWLYNCSLAFTKVAILLQYLRIFTQRWFRRTTWCVFAFVCLSSCWTIIGTIFSCVPVQYFWNRSIPGKCLPQAVTWYFNAGLNVVTDLLIILLPMPVLKNLNMPLKQRMALMFVFALGGFVCIISVIRIEKLRAIASRLDDMSYHNVSASSWSVIEVNVAIVCACLPAFKAIVTRIFPHLFTTIGAGTGNSARGGLSSGPRRQGYSQHSGRFHRGAASADPECGPYSAATATKAHNRSWSHAFGAGNLRDLQGTELKTFSHGVGEDVEQERGKIAVMTVVEQEVEHRRVYGIDVPAESSGSASQEREGSEAGSEKGLFASREVGR